MFCADPILIVEDDALIALSLALAVEEAQAQVIGPAATVAEALALIAGQPISAAILDANLPDGNITPLAVALAADGIPFVVFTGTGLPPDLADVLPNTPVVMKPACPTVVLDRLAGEIRSHAVTAVSGR